MSAPSGLEVGIQTGQACPLTVHAQKLAGSREVAGGEQQGEHINRPLLDTGHQATQSRDLCGRRTKDTNAPQTQLVALRESFPRREKTSRAPQSCWKDKEGRIYRAGHPRRKS